jgi:hypothetical protein
MPADQVHGLAFGTDILTTDNQLQDGQFIKRQGTSLVGAAGTGGASWGQISGTLANQTDLSGALAAKEPANANIQTHVTSAHAPSNAQKNSDITKGEIEAKLTGEISSHTHAGGGGGNGYCLQGSAANQATTTDSQTLYWGDIQLAPSTTAGNTRVYIPKAGTVKAAYVFAHAATAGTAENWTMNIRINNSTDTLIQTLGLSSSQRVWSNTSLALAVALGDYIEIKEVQPAWATNPANVRRSFVLYIE